jgi:hypothetical protein
MRRIVDVERRPPILSTESPLRPLLTALILAAGCVSYQLFNRGADQYVSPALPPKALLRHCADSLGEEFRTRGALTPQLAKSQELTFDSERWKIPVRWRIPGPIPRNAADKLQMLPDLLARHPLIGMKKSDLERLIGPPREEEPDCFPIHFSGGCTRLYSLWLQVSCQGERITKYRFCEWDSRCRTSPHGEPVTRWVTQ